MRRGPRLDVEGAAAGDDGLLGARMDAVVAHVPHAAEHNALREAIRARVIPCSQLAQHRQQGIAHESIDLVDEQDQRSRIRLRQPADDFLQRTVGSRPLQDVGPDPVHEVVLERQPGTRGELAEDRAHRPLDVFAP
jgi:hypothetical protein